MTAETILNRAALLAAAAEKAADRIIDEVWQLKDGTSPQVKQPEAAPGEAK